MRDRSAVQNLMGKRAWSSAFRLLVSASDRLEGASSLKAELHALLRSFALFCDRLEETGSLKAELHALLRSFALFRDVSRFAKFIS